MDLDRNIAMWNQSHAEEKVSVSYGYAFYAGEKHEKIRESYKKADENMYEFKKEIKAREGIPSRQVLRTKLRKTVRKCETGMFTCEH